MINDSEAVRAVKEPMLAHLAQDLKNMVAASKNRIELKTMEIKTEQAFCNGLIAARDHICKLRDDEAKR